MQNMTALSLKCQHCLLYLVEQVCFSITTVSRMTKEGNSKVVAGKITLKYSFELNIMTHNSIQV